MFILHGSKEEFLSETIDQQNACLKCRGLGIHVAHYQRYYHFFFLPAFPLGKSLRVRCLICGAQQEHCATTALVAIHKSPAKTSLKYWLGTLFILIVVISFYSIIRKNSMDEKSYIENPMIGDIYTLHDSVTFENGRKQKAYQYLKVYKVTNDSIFIIDSNLAHEGYMSISKVLEKEDLFTDRLHAFPRQAILELFNEDRISSVHRPKVIPNEATN